MLKVDSTWWQYQDESVTGLLDVRVVLAPVYEVFGYNDTIATSVQDKINHATDEVIIISSIHKSDNDQNLHITLWIPSLTQKYHLRVQLVDTHWRYVKLLDPKVSSNYGGSGTCITNTFNQNQLKRYIPQSWPHQDFVTKQQKDFAEGFTSVGRSGGNITGGT